MSDTPLSRASSAVLRRGSALLAVWNPKLSGWTLPGGKAEPGEEPFETMRREVREEAGVWVGGAVEIFAGEHKTERGSFLVTVFAADWASCSSERFRMHEPDAPVGWLSIAHFLEHSPFRPFYEQFLRPASTA